MDKAACVVLKADPLLFQPVDGKTRISTEQKAKAFWYCRRCPVTEQCQTFGEDAHVGIYAGKYISKKWEQVKGNSPASLRPGVT